jgi:hypothetical protein
MDPIDLTRLRLADDPRVSVVQVGTAPHQVATVIDGIYRDPDYVRELALSLDFTRPRGKFPGYEARLSLASPCRAIADLLSKIVGVSLEPHGSSKHDLVFSMADERTDSKLRRIRHPHIDGALSGGAFLASLVYLNPPHQCSRGTGFYRHRETGANEVVADVSTDFLAYQTKQGTTSLSRTYAKILESCVGVECPLSEGQWDTLLDSDEVWEKTGEIEMVYNRLVLYNARLFHSPIIANATFGATNESRRLTQTSWFIEPFDPARGIDPQGLIQAGLVG